LIHDVLPLHQIDYLLNPFLRFQFLTQLRKHRSAKKIVTVSHFSKQDILRCLKVPEKKIEVIYNGVSPLFAQKKIISKSTISNYILYVGDLRKRKNVLTLAKAYLALPIQLQNKYPFVFTGEGEQKKKIIQLFKQKKTLAFLHSIGKVSEEELPKWYQNAELFVFPSLFEGFGLPIVEAQKSGIPVICGKNSSLPEIAGKGALITDVRNPKSLTEAMYKILTDENFKKKLTDLGTANAERFSWEQTASQYVKVFADIFNNDFKN
jgi:glycosyltransferase involved in cell wall biosynthesis